jgi:hypothetical protein
MGMRRSRDRTTRILRGKVIDVPPKSVKNSYASLWHGPGTVFIIRLRTGKSRCGYTMAGFNKEAGDWE